VSQRNGDKARFGRERQRKLLLRERTRESRKALETKTGSTPSVESPGKTTKPSGRLTVESIDGRSVDRAPST
jgi:hypothetical protein